MIEGAPALYEQVDMILKVQPPQMHPATHLPEAGMVREGSAYIGFLSPLAHPDVMETFARRKITAFAMDFVPRLTRAQSMDALTSMSTVAGYKAVLLATEHLGKMFPLLMPVRLCANRFRVWAQPSLRWTCRRMRKQQAAMPKSDLPGFSSASRKSSAPGSPGWMWSSAQVFGKRAPVLITTEMVRSLRPGSVIVDLAAEQGGNCELTQAGQTIEYEGVTVVGATNVPAMLPSDASQLPWSALLNITNAA